MPSFSAKPHRDRPSPRCVVFLVYDNIVLLDLVGPLQVFSHASDLETGQNGYACTVASRSGGMVTTNTVVEIPTVPVCDLVTDALDTLVVVGGDGARDAMHDPAIVKTVQGLAAQARRVCSVCSGALVLAAAGVLDGRRAVTHWEDCEILDTTFPNVTVEEDPIYVKDGDVWTSAGITAGIDMALAIVAEDLGRASALQMARSMVTQMVRSGGQSQFSPDLSRQSRDATGQFETLHAWIRGHLNMPLTVEILAGRANMSARNFSRVYSRVMGMTPAKAVEVMRAEAARHLLETGDDSIKQIATECGFGDEERMRRAFLRVLNVSPSAYRQTFRAI